MERARGSAASCPRVSKRPWLRRKDWEDRQVLATAAEVRSGLFYFLALLGVLAFGGPALWLAKYAWSARGLDALERLLMGGLAGFLGLVPVIIVCAVIQRRRYGTSVCYLETLPGVIGGWFKATVEAKLPGRPEGPLVAELTNCCLSGGLLKSREMTTVWGTKYDVPASALKDIGEGKYRIPVRFRIPRDDYAPIRMRPTWFRAEFEGVGV